MQEESFQYLSNLMSEKESKKILDELSNPLMLKWLLENFKYVRLGFIIGILKANGTLNDNHDKLIKDILEL